MADFDNYHKQWYSTGSFNCERCRRPMSATNYDQYDGLCYDCNHPATCDKCLEPMTTDNYNKYQGICYNCFKLLKRVKARDYLTDLD